MATASLDALSLGFRNAYLDHERLTAQLRAWADAFPELAQLRSLGKTPHGRDIWLLVIGREPERIRPAAWVDGNMHAIELAGSSVALGIAEDVLRLHLDQAPPEVSRPVRERVTDMLWYVLPRISPDGAECILKTGRYVRSLDRDDRPNRGAPRWLASDVDGDGLAQTMRVVDRGGEVVESKTVPGLMVERTVDDEGPFYKLYPEGTIEHFDGHTVPSPFFLGDNPIDLNRNFPWSWSPSHEQIGAGPHPGSEPESRAIIEFVTKHPEIVTWLNLHCFGGVVIRPLGHAPDSKMNQEDLAVFRQVEAWMTQFTGYPTVSGFDEFLYEPDKPLKGDLSDYAYMQRGALSFVVELWDLFARLGIERPKRFVDYYGKVGPAELAKLHAFDREHNGGRIFLPWRPFEHPQLGKVEVGGVDPRVGVWNPPLGMLADVCRGQSAAYLRVAALAPKLELGAVTRTKLADGVTQVDVRVENVGYLGSYGVASAKGLDFNEPVYARAEATGGAAIDAGSAHQVLGHLDGWGRGLNVGTGAPDYPSTRGTSNAATARYVVRGHGALALRVGSARMGFVGKTIEV